MQAAYSTAPAMVKDPLKEGANYPFLKDKARHLLDDSAALYWRLLDNREVVLPGVRVEQLAGEGSDDR
jgi:hypothetical protein